VNQDCLKLTTYFAEHHKAGRRFLADALLDCYGRHRLATSVLLRGTEGFGSRLRLQTQRLLTLSEDLPVVTVAVDTRERIEQALDEVTALATHGLVTLERARLLTGQVGAVRLPEEPTEATKLTVYVGRGEQATGRPAFLAVVDLLRRHGVDGATVLLGVDGTAHGVRQRARFFGRNAAVPLMIIAVGASAAIAAALPELGAMLDHPLLTLERIRVCKHDGRKLAEPERLPGADPGGLGMGQKLMVYAGRRPSTAGTRYTYSSLVACWRLARPARPRYGASGATTASTPPWRPPARRAASGPGAHRGGRYARTDPQVVRDR
jgi:PII-like signaling protein